jgi:NADPH:quinone reductase-like Zn-dependent oxidoreductase
MRAAIFHHGDFTVGSLPDPVLAEGQVLVRTRACGICGSDLHAAKYTDAFVDVARRSGGRFAMVKDRPIVFGHEFVGEVVANGPGTEGRFAPGATHEALFMDRWVQALTGWQPEFTVTKLWAEQVDSCKNQESSSELQRSRILQP